MLRAFKTLLLLLFSVPIVCMAVLVFMITRKDGLLYLMGEPVIESDDAGHIRLTQQEELSKATGIQAV